MSKQKLSQRLRKSAGKEFEKHLNSPYVSQLLMNGSGIREPKKFAVHILKDLKDIVDTWKKIFELGINKTDDPEEKEIFQLCILGIPEIWNKLKQNFSSKFGDLDENYLSGPMTQHVWSYSQHMIKEASLGSLLNLLAVYLPSLLLTLVTNDYIMKNPEFKPNLYYELLSLEEFELDKLVHTLESMIDLREELVSEEEEKHLCEIFKRSVIYKTLIIEYAMN